MADQDQPARPASEFADSWQQTGSLLALREVVLAANRCARIARRAGLSETDLVAMEHLLEGARRAR